MKRKCKRMIQKTAKYFSTAYILLLFCVYPFYMEDGYYNIGDAKMHFFMKVSLAAFLVLSLFYLVLLVSGIRKRTEAGQAYYVDWEQVSAVDLLMLVYATTLFLSYAFSANKGQALWGEEGWYMGLIPLLLLCGLYFLISRLWSGGIHILYPIMAASAVVFALGICNRFSCYPIVIEGGQPDFISTLGNINWFCGFMSVAASLGVSYFVVGKDLPLWKRVLLSGYAFLSFMASFAQGSDSIFLWFGTVFLLLLWIAADNSTYLEYWFLLLFIWAAAAGAVRGLRVVTVDRYNYETGGICGYFTGSYVTVWIAVAAIAGFAVLHRKSKKQGKAEEAHLQKLQKGSISRKKIRIGIAVTVVLALLLWISLSVVNMVVGISFLQGKGLFTLDADWGHGRGVAIWTGIQIFREQSLLHKLIGVGPDCFAWAAYEVPEIAFALREHFGTARLTNAHNECLTALVNTGILGVCSYVGVLLTAIGSYIKAGRDKAEVMLSVFTVAIAGYFIHNMVSFAQVLNIPFLFVIMGMAEAKKRHTR